MMTMKYMAVAVMILAASAAIANAQETSQTVLPGLSRAEALETVTYPPIGEFNSESMLEFLEKILQGKQNVTATVDSTSGNIVVVAPSSDQAQIRQWLDLMSEDPSSSEQPGAGRRSRVSGGGGRGGRGVGSRRRDEQGNISSAFGGSSAGGTGAFGGTTTGIGGTATGFGGTATGFGGTTTGIGGTATGFGGSSRYSTYGGARISAADRALVLVTAPMTPEIRSAWKEDLGIMDRLLSDATTRTSGVSSTAMGIRVDRGDLLQPIYLEGTGMLLSYGVNMPLGAGKQTTNEAQQPSPTPPSAWELAKRQLATESTTPGLMPPVVAAPVMADYTIFVKFNPAKLEELVAAVTKILPEAKNVRHLKADEFVIVTISGADDGGGPLRLTLKAKKADIDEAAAGRISPEEFKKRVVWHVG